LIEKKLFVVIVVVIAIIVIHTSHIS
jgi:hypothetical protein